MKYGCIGYPLSHSFSTELHRMFGDAEYTLRELPPDELRQFLEKREFSGLNVTIPYKTAVIPYLDGLSETAARIGSVNTVVNRDGKLIGYNTDLFGLEHLFSHAGISLNGKKVAVLGSGGTFLTARTLAVKQGASEILSVSRTPGRGQIGYAELCESHRDIEVLINATPVGMFPHEEDKPISLEPFSRLCMVADAVYHPLRTRLVLSAKEKGIPACGGLPMLVAQAARAFELFHGVTAEDRIEPVYEALLRKKETIVLCGMPGCGKTTVGGLLAGMTGRTFCDSDAEVEKETGKTIPELFASCGESGFRKIESEVIKRLAKESGIVLSTGGGTVLDRENMTRLRQNGTIVFLDRPLADLPLTEGRPLARSREDLEQCYRDRYDLYVSLADRTVAVDTDAESLAIKLKKEFFGI